MKPVIWSRSSAIHEGDPEAACSQVNRSANWLQKRAAREVYLAAL